MVVVADSWIGVKDFCFNQLTVPLYVSVSIILFVPPGIDKHFQKGLCCVTTKQRCAPLLFSSTVSISLCVRLKGVFSVKEIHLWMLICLTVRQRGLNKCTVKAALSAHRAKRINRLVGDWIRTKVCVFNWWSSIYLYINIWSSVYAFIWTWMQNGLYSTGTYLKGIKDLVEPLQILFFSEDFLTTNKCCWCTLWCKRWVSLCGLQGAHTSSYAKSVHIQIVVSGESFFCG